MVQSSKARSKQTSLVFHSITITKAAKVLERVVLQEVVVEDLVAVLLVNVAL